MITKIFKYIVDFYDLKRYEMRICRDNDEMRKKIYFMEDVIIALHENKGGSGYANMYAAELSHAKKKRSIKVMEELMNVKK